MNRITLIASVGEKNELGCEGDLCWYIREDLRHFKALTMGSAVIMGRKTWESLPKKPLPGRTNIILTHNPAPLLCQPGEQWADSVGKAIEKAGEQQVFIIGGESIYRLFLPMAHRLVLTRIYASDPKADKFFPEFSDAEWKLEQASDIMTSENGLRFRYETWERI